MKISKMSSSSFSSRYKAVIVLDTLPFESLNNDNLYKYLDNFFVILWTSAHIVGHHHRHHNNKPIPFDGYINGLRNGYKPYKYLRMYLREYMPLPVLGLPVVIFDFEKYYINSRYGYDMCIDLTSVINEQTYNNRQIAVIDTRTLFKRIDTFLQQYADSSAAVIINETTLLSKSAIFTSNDVFNRNKRPYIGKRTAILVVSPIIFENWQNVDCHKFQQYVSEYFLVVWMDNKNSTKEQIYEYIHRMKSTYKIRIDYMLFGHDHNIKHISLVRRHLAPTHLSFVLIDNLANIYDPDHTANNIYDIVCDFDYYINLAEYAVNSKFYDMESIFKNIKNFIQQQSISRITSDRSKDEDKIKIVEILPSSDDNDDDDAAAAAIDNNNENTSGRISQRSNIFEVPAIKRFKKATITTTTNPSYYNTSKQPTNNGRRHPRSQ